MSMVDFYVSLQIYIKQLYKQIINVDINNNYYMKIKKTGVTVINRDNLSTNSYHSIFKEQNFLL